MTQINEIFEKYEQADELKAAGFPREYFQQTAFDDDGQEFGVVDDVAIPLSPQYLREGQITDTPPAGVSVQLGRSDTPVAAPVESAPAEEPAVQPSEGLAIAGVPLRDIEVAINAPFAGIGRGVSRFIANTASFAGLIPQEDVDKFFKSLDEINKDVTEGNIPAIALGGVADIAGQFVIPAATGIKAFRALGATPLVASVIADSLVGLAGMSPNDANVFNMLAEDSSNPAVAAVRNLLATDPDDGEWANRSRNATEALVFLGGSEALIRSLPYLFQQTKRFVKTGVGRTLEGLEDAGRAADERIAELSRGNTMMANPIAAAADVAISGAGRVANTLSPSIRRKALELVQDPIVDDELPSLLDVLEKKADEMAFKPVDRTQPSGDQMFDVEPESYVRHIDPALQVETPVPRAPEGAKLPLKARAAGLVERMDEVASVLAERARPYVGTNVQYFYHLGPLISKAEALGIPRQEAKENIRDFALMYGATSPRTRTEPNLRSASLVRAKQSEGIEYNEVIGPRRDGLNEVGYPMMINEAVPGTGAGIHKILIERVRDTGVIDYRTNPKPATFVENVNGNLNGITVDTHAIRAALHVLNELSPGSLPQQWFKPAAYKAYLADPSDINNYAGKEVVDTLAGQVVDGIKQQTEYALFSDLYRLVAEKLNVQPAEAQSLSWFANGKYTGLGSPPKTIVELVNERVDVTAQALGKSKDAIFKGFMQGKIPLMSVGGALVGVNSLRQPDAKQAPDS
jgi:hypothetical protein